MMFFQIIFAINPRGFHFFYRIILTDVSNYDKLMDTINE